MKKLFYTFKIRPSNSMPQITKQISLGTSRLRSRRQHYYKHLYIQIMLIYRYLSYSTTIFKSI